MFITHFCPSTVLLAIHTFNKLEILQIVKMLSLCLRVCIFTCLLFADFELFTSIFDIKQGQRKDLINGHSVKISFFPPLSLFSPRLISSRIYTYDSVYSKLQFIKHQHVKTNSACPPNQNRGVGFKICCKLQLCIPKKLLLERS